MQKMAQTLQRDPSTSPEWRSGWGATPHRRPARAAPLSTRNNSLLLSVQAYRHPYYPRRGILENE